MLPKSCLSHLVAVVEVDPIASGVERGDGQCKCLHAVTGASPGSSLEPFGQKIPFHRQLDNLDVQIVDLVLMIQTGLIGTTGKQSTKTFHCMALPRTNLIGVHLVASSYLMDRLVASKRFKRNLGLKVPCKPSSRRHIVFLRYPAQYTLTPCPIL